MEIGIESFGSNAKLVPFYFRALPLRNTVVPSNDIKNLPEFFQNFVQRAEQKQFTDLLGHLLSQKTEDDPVFQIMLDYSFAWCYYHLARYDNAEKHLDRALKNLLMGIGRAVFLVNDRELVVYQLMLDSGAVQFAKKHYERSLKSFEKAQKVALTYLQKQQSATDDGEYAYWQAKACLALDKIKEAYALAKIFSEAQKNNFYYLLLHAQILLKTQGEEQKGIEILRLCIEDFNKRNETDNVKVIALRQAYGEALVPTQKEKALKQFEMVRNMQEGSEASATQKAETLYYIACMQTDLGKTQKAKKTLDEMIAKLKDEESDLHAQVLLKRAEVEDGGVTSEKGKKFKERGDTILKNIAGNLHNKAVAFEAKGEILNAQNCFEESLQRKIKIYGEDNDSELVSTYEGLAVIYDQIGLFEKSCELFRKSLDIKKKLFGEDNVKTATTKENFAILLHHHNSDLPEAKRLLEEVLEAKKKKHKGSEENSDVSRTMGNLAIVCDTLNERETAERLGRRALEIEIAVFGAKDLQTALTLFNLAKILANSEKIQEAKDNLQRAKDILSELYGKGNYHQYAQYIAQLDEVLNKEGQGQSK